MSRPWMPIYWGDILRDTLHCDAELFGAYMLLIAEYWNKGKLPDSDESKRQIARLTSQKWRHHREVLAAFFDPMWQHKRIDAEIEKCEILKTKRQIAGMRGGLAKRGNTNRGKIVTEAIAKQLGKHPQSHSNVLSFLGGKGVGDE